MDFSDERLRAMLRGRREVRDYPLPGASDDSELRIGLRVLTGEEIDDAKIDAAQYIDNLAKRRKLDAQQLQWIDGDPYQAEVIRQQLFRACLASADEESAERSEERQHFFPSPQALRQRDDSFVQMLHQLYLIHQQWVNPYLNLSREEAVEIVEALKKTPDRRAVLGLYDVPTLLNLADIMVVQLASVPTGK